MNEIISENSASDLLKNRKFYGVIKAPDGQRFRFDISAIFKKLVEENSEKVFSGMEDNFSFGKELYEKAQQEGNPYPVTEQFLDCHKDSTESGKSSAVFYLSHEVCREALDLLEVIIYSEDSKEEWQEAHSSLIKFGKENDEIRKKEQQINRECAEYWRGYDDAKAEMRKKLEENQKEDSQKGFWNNFVKWILRQLNLDR